jgi:hypothetical protein
MGIKGMEYDEVLCPVRKKAQYNTQSKRND